MHASCVRGAPAPVSMRPATPWLRRAVLALAAGVLAVLLGTSGLTAMLDDTVYRMLDAPRQPLSAPPALVLGIDAGDPWPWPSTRITDMIERLRGAGVRGVAWTCPCSPAREMTRPAMRALPAPCSTTASCWAWR